MEYKISRLLWENLESVLLAQSRRLIGEYSKIIGVPEKELQKKVLPSSDFLKITIQDTHAESNQCKAYVQNEKLTIFCRKPVGYGCEYCPFHRNKRMIVVPGTNPIPIQRIKDTGSFWVSHNTVYDSKGDMIGKIKDGIIKIFVY